MTTFKDLQNIVLNNLHGQTLEQEQRCALAVTINSSATSFTVDDATQVSRGLIEIDSELMWVKAIDASTNIITLSGFGRGYGETTAVSHASGAMLVNNPSFPRQYVKDSITDVIAQIYPELFVVKKDESNTVVATTLTYPLPADADQILDISWQSIGPSKMWVPVKRWRYDAVADTGAFASGKSVDIFDAMVPGRTVKITYQSAPSGLVNDADTLASTGLSEGVRDVITFGACARLIQSLEVGRLQTNTISQSDRDAITQPGAATGASRAFWALHQARLSDEQARLQRLYPARTHMTR